MKKHTDLPWTAMPVTSHDGRNVIEITGINSVYWVAHVRGVKKDYTQDEKIETLGNAELIIRAVNHHGQLVEALKDCIARMKRARNILQTGATPGHWGLLDTDSISQLLNSIDNGK